MAEQITRTVLIGNVSSTSGIRKNDDGTPKLSKEGQPLRWTRFSLEDNAGKFVGSTFDSGLAKVLEENMGKTMTVEIEVKDGERGSLYDLLAARPASELTAITSKAPATATDGQGAIPTAERNLHIIREVALKAAIDYVSGQGHQLTYENMDETLKVADCFAAWILGANDRPTE